MAGFFVLFTKELRDHLRTYKLIVVVAIFFAFGLATPLLFKYLPALLAVEGVAIPLPEFTAVDALKEYLDTLGQVGLMAAILVGMGAVSRERELGTAAMTLSKPVGRGAFVVAKLAALALTFGIGIAVGALGCYVYTLVLFGDVGASGFLAANLLMGLYILVCLAVTVMYSCFFRSQLAAGALALVTLIGLAVTSGLPVLRDYSPGTLTALSQRIASDSGPVVWGAVAAAVVLAVATTVAGWQAFQRKEL